MNIKVSIILEFLSAGVIASLTTGIFSLIITIKNNRRLAELENDKQKFTLNQERYKGLKDAYIELLTILPDEKLLGHVIQNLPSQNKYEDQIFYFYKIADTNIKIMYSHYQKYSYLFLDDEQKKLSNLIVEIDDITKSINAIELGLQEHNIDCSEDTTTEKEKITKKILKIAEFEEVYYDLFRDDLSKLSK